MTPKITPAPLKFNPETVVGIIGLVSISCCILKLVGSQPRTVGNLNLARKNGGMEPENGAHPEACRAEGEEVAPC